MISPRIIKRALVNAWRSRHISAPLDVIKGFFYNTPISIRWKNLNLMARTDDWCAVQEIFLEHEYKIALDVLKDTSNPIVVDLGANIGGFSAYILAARPDARLMSMEASQNTFALLQDNAAHNPNYNWQTYHFAAWKENGTISFAQGKHSTSSHVAALKNDATLSTESVPTIDFPTVFETANSETIHLMKIDIEGAEEAFLHSANEDLMNKVDSFLIEFHPNIVDMHDLYNFIEITHPVIQVVGNRKSSKPLVLFCKA